MKLTEVKKSYEQIIEKEKLKHSKLSKTIFQIGTIRLLIVIGCIVCSYILWGDSLVVFSIIAFSTIAFLALMVFHNKLFKRRLYSEIQIKNAENELKGIDYDFSTFDGAPEFIDAEHSFSLDLDLFGNRSFFQSINRSVTVFGKKSLSNILLAPLQGKTEITARQEAIKELALNPKLATHFRAIGQMSESSNLDVKEFSQAFIQSSSSSVSNTFWKIMTYVLPAIYIVWFIGFLFNIVDTDSFYYLWIFTLLFSCIPMKRASKMVNLFDRKTATLETYSNLFEIIEKEDFKSVSLQNLQTRLGGKSGASEAIKQLKSYQDNLILSSTFPILMILNPLLLWNIRYISLTEKWIKKNMKNVEAWFDTLADFDALISLSIFAYNHPDYTYPEVSDSVIFEGKRLGHPMLNRDICVRNDVSISKKPFFLVITGANMAGKSTYLRTIGINHTLACAGMPVCAKSLYFRPGMLITNLRTSDSLADNESYFFAELKRLKMIIDRLQSGEELFIILDEILKGTNSEDKQKGSLALMRQLVELFGYGIIATHDLLLGKLEKEYPDNVKNYCFEAEIKNDHLSFSYKMMEGVAQNMNACFLMKKMGITGL